MTPNEDPDTPGLALNTPSTPKLKEVHQSETAKGIISLKEAIISGDKIPEIAETRNFLIELVKIYFITPQVAYLALQRVQKHFEPQILDHIQSTVLEDNPHAIEDILTMVKGVGIKEQDETMVIMKKCPKMAKANNLVEIYETCAECGKYQRKMRDFSDPRAANVKAKCPLDASILYIFGFLELSPPNNFVKLIPQRWEEGWPMIEREVIFNCIDEFLEAFFVPIESMYTRTLEQRATTLQSITLQSLDVLEHELLNWNLQILDYTKNGIMEIEVTPQMPQQEGLKWKMKNKLSWKKK